MAGQPAIPTVRVRIAVAVDSEGRCFAAVSNPKNGSTYADKEAIWNVLEQFTDEHVRISFVEADVPLPVAQTVEGKAVPRGD